MNKKRQIIWEIVLISIAIFFFRDNVAGTSYERGYVRQCLSRWP